MTHEVMTSLTNMRRELTNWHAYVTQLLKQMDGVDMNTTQKVFHAQLRLLAGALSGALHASNWTGQVYNYGDKKDT